MCNPRNVARLEIVKLENFFNLEKNFTLEIFSKLETSFDPRNPFKLESGFLTRKMFFFQTRKKNIFKTRNLFYYSKILQQSSKKNF